MTPPAPATSRPAIWTFHDADSAITTLPASISSSAPSTVVLSPNLWPMAPPGNASATPGAKYNPIRMPISARLTPSSLESSGATAATLWNWNAMVARTANRTARIPQRLRNALRAFLLDFNAGAAEIEPLDDVVAFQFVDRIGRDHDLAMDDDVAAIGDPDRLIEVLLRHQHRQAETLVELADLGDGLRDQQRRQADRRLVDQQQARRRHQRARDRQHLLLPARHGAGELASAVP